MKRLKAVLAICGIALVSGFRLSAQDEIIIVRANEPTITTLLSTRPQSMPDTALLPLDEVVRPSHFTWGADLGSSFDLTNQGLSSFDLSACFGYRNRALRFLGVGAGVNVMLSNSSRIYPVYAQMRTTFTSRQKFVFLDVKGGICFANYYNRYTRRPPFGSIALGFTLASGRNFSSHISVGYAFVPISEVKSPENNRVLKDLHQAVIRLGVAF